VFYELVRKQWDRGIAQNVVWYDVKGCCEKAGLHHIAPHDMRRTCAKLCHSNGGELEQIQFLLGHASEQTTERYLGCKQNLGHPVNDLFHLEVVATTCPIIGTAVIERADRIVYEHGVGSDQEGADPRTCAGNAGDGNSSV
jgi:Phage integrase family